MRVQIFQRGFRRGQWEVRKLSLDRETAIVHCPTCSAINTLDDYSVSTDGTVQPLFSCLNGCGYEGYLQLGGWRDR